MITENDLRIASEFFPVAAYDSGDYLVRYPDDSFQLFKAQIFRQIFSRIDGGKFLCHNLTIRYQ